MKHFFYLLVNTIGYNNNYITEKMHAHNNMCNEIMLSPIENLNRKSIINLKTNSWRS